MKIKLFTLFFTCILVHCLVYADDVVIYQSALTGRHVKATGAIENYSREELTLRTASGNILSIKTDSIDELIVDRSPTYSEAELWMKNREYEKALPLLKQALVQAPDGWMKHEILARQTQCLYNLNRIDEAALLYIQLTQLAPNTAFYDCVPLVWTSAEASPRTQQMAQTWIRQQKYPYAALLGASLLLTSDKKNEAQRALNALAKSENADVAALAQMQLNRLSLTPLPSTTLNNLEKEIEALPKTLQFGPRFVLAQLWGRSSDEEIQVDKTVLNYLQCAINSNTPVELKTRAFYSAGSALLTAERRDEAFRIFKRLIEQFPDSQWSQQAKRVSEGNL